MDMNQSNLNAGQPGATPGAQGAGEPGNEDAGRTRRSATEIISDLERERDEKIAKIMKDYGMKIAKAKRNAVPASERRKAALDLLDGLRDKLRAELGDLTLDDSAVDAILLGYITKGFEAQFGHPMPADTPAADGDGAGAGAGDGAGEGTGDGQGAAPEGGQPAGEGGAAAVGDGAQGAAPEGSGETGGQPASSAAGEPGKPDPFL